MSLFTVCLTLLLTAKESLRDKQFTSLVWLQQYKFHPLEGKLFHHCKGCVLLSSSASAPRPPPLSSSSCGYQPKNKSSWLSPFNIPGTILQALSTWTHSIVTTFLWVSLFLLQRENWGTESRKKFVQAIHSFRPCDFTLLPCRGFRSELPSLAEVASGITPINYPLSDYSKFTWHFEPQFPHP